LLKKINLEREETHLVIHVEYDFCVKFSGLHIAKDTISERLLKLLGSFLRTRQIIVEQTTFQFFEDA
jgi:hypothetical protein